MNTRILIVEDNPDNMKLINWILEDEGYETVQAYTADEAFVELAKQKFDMILMDISLPGMDGKEATRQLRANPKYASLPIIAVTAHAIKGEENSILSSGVSALITKPVHEPDLIRTIRSFLTEEVSVD